MTEDHLQRALGHAASHGILGRSTRLFVASECRVGPMADEVRHGEVRPDREHAPQLLERGVVPAREVEPVRAKHAQREVEGSDVDLAPPDREGPVVAPTLLRKKV